MRLKLQSAMEYLMTYGWAILIIAVVLGALFGLGFFSSASLAPKVGPGACQVYRPNGPGTTLFINLEGACNNELPQYIAQFNGAGSSVDVPTTSNLNFGTGSFSVSGWVKPNTGLTSIYIITNKKANINSNSIGWSLGLDYRNAGASGSNNAPGIVEFRINDGTTLNDKVFGPPFPANLISTFNGNQWVYVTAVVSVGNTVTFYVNGVNYGFDSLSGIGSVSNPSDLYIGGSSAVPYFPGSVANLQVYNTSLSANEVTALYQEGIGGVPVLQQKLVGWWQLNGNANDYSGNLNNGVSTSIVFTSSWTSGYTAP